MTPSEWPQGAEHLVSAVVRSLKHGRTLSGFAQEHGMKVESLHAWLMLNETRAAAYRAVSRPRGRPTKLDQAARLVATQDFAHGGLTGAARWLGVDRTTIYNWRDTMTMEGS